MTKITSTIFKEYDIRGKIGKELNEEVAFRLGQLFAYNLEQKYVVIGRDNRESSKILVVSFIKGILSSGANVMELEGVVTSPQLYFASEFLKTKGAVMVTGSHNSLEDNGFKFLLDNKPFYSANLRNILQNPILSGNGQHNIINLDKEYTEALKRNITLKKNNRIIWECNNSGIAKIISMFNLSGKHRLLNEEVGGAFKNKLPDPFIPETLNEIKENVASYDYGFAFDGDADRLVVIKSDGTILTSDQLIYLFALSLKKQKNKKIIVDVKASQILINRLQEDGFEVVIAPSGHSLMKERIIRENASLAGESSGHIIFNDGRFFPFDDALYGALRLIEYLQNNPIIELPLANFRNEFKIAKNLNLDPQIYLPEGLRINYEDGFLLIRASNTEDYILVKYEAMSEETNNIIKELIENIV